LDPAVKVLAQGVPGNLFQSQASLAQVHVRDFISNPLFHHEVFGPASLMVVCDDLDQLQDGIRSLEGQLAASMFVAPGDEDLARHLLGLLGRKAGRLIVNDFATGVEVNRVMVHGGPYPATTDSRTTSVGALAIERFLRPICVQGLHPSSDLLRSQRG
jgi:NADP-dependent aldehyde dehydrogenase